MSNPPIRTENGLWTPMGDVQITESDRFDELMSEARRVQENAYAPYSKFHVGAAALFEGSIFIGCNVENASYGGTICAERSAIFSAVAHGAKRLDMIAITTDARSKPIESRSPCGFCRQVIAEFASADTLVLLDAGSTEDTLYLGEAIRFSDLLPLQFKLD